MIILRRGIQLSQPIFPDDLYEIDDEVIRNDNDSDREKISRPCDIGNTFLKGKLCFLFLFHLLGIFW